MSEITNKNSLFVLCSSLENHGGWVLDTQFIVNMGLPYLLAHGLGNPVNDAHGKVKFPEKGSYRVWVYTKTGRHTGSLNMHLVSSVLYAAIIAVSSATESRTGIGRMAV